MTRSFHRDHRKHAGTTPAVPPKSGATYRPIADANDEILAAVLSVARLLPPPALAIELGLGEDAIRYRLAHDHHDLRNWGAHLVALARLEQRLRGTARLADACLRGMLGDFESRDVAPAEIALRPLLAQAGAVLTHAMDALGDDGRLDAPESAALLDDLDHLAARVADLRVALRRRISEAR